MTNNTYEVKKNIDKIKNRTHTHFITPNIYQEITHKLKKNEYNIYAPNQDSDKIILYTKKVPTIHLLQIESSTPITHAQILGSLFSLNITNEVFGDIIIDNNNYYFYVVNEIKDFIEKNLTQIGQAPIKLIEVPLDTLKNYQKKFQTIELIVSSLRIDTVIAKLINAKRDTIKSLMNKKEILLNYNYLTNNSYQLKENDIFSIRKHGKYKYIEIIKTTKKDNYIITIKKYI